ncbi:MAG: type II toxin-antitoxin system PemK/MazF family toxin [Burkholderiaceae bacterium]|nr:type II toxin-antitoxin system PemK/MazF family toxin [Burkholderiaceae bacterium]MDO9090183.1 type II toxin-antitoxin system PemK/MazF family toxin [Burkholderiaceae bacterium]
MDRGDIYLVSLDPTSGQEQQGTRPVLAMLLQACPCGAA